jgi:hypothetical protein
MDGWSTFQMIQTCKQLERDLHGRAGVALNVWRVMEFYDATPHELVKSYYDDTSDIFEYYVDENGYHEEDYFDEDISEEFERLKKTFKVHTVFQSRNLNEHVDAHVFSGVHNATFIDCNHIFNLEHLAGVNTVTLIECGRFDINALVRAGVCNVTIDGYWTVVDDEIIDVSMLAGMKNVTLKNFRGSLDVSGLGKVHTLTLSNCPQVIGVNMLGDVKNLTLDACKDISDVSALGGVENLTLMDCENISDVSALSSVPNLTIFSCNVRDYSMLGGVHTLHIGYGHHLTSGLGLETVHNLTLSYCYEFYDFDALSSVKKLTVKHPIE